ncbi:flagellar hook-basal body complex protein FliE [bacterium]|nr:flagellar hook-basal body complex protein FliE [bacterium]
MRVSNVGIQNLGGYSNSNNYGQDKRADFKSVITEHLSKVSSMESSADQKMQDFVVGKNDNLHEIIVAGEKAKLALEFTVEMRNKVVNAYKEIMRMPI